MRTQAGLMIVANPALPGLESFRQNHIHHPGKAVPAHLTLLGLGDLDSVPVDALRDLFSTQAPFAYELVCVNSFPTTHVLWLAPVPVGPFEAVVDSVYRLMPDLSRAWPYPTFHLTIGLAPDNATMMESLDAFWDEFGGHLPWPAQATGVELWAEVDGSYRCIESFPFAPALD